MPRRQCVVKTPFVSILSLLAMAMFMALLLAKPAQAKVKRAPKSLTRVRQRQFSVQGKPFVLTEKLNADGHVVEQVLMSNDRAEISIDRGGKGWLDSWQLISPGRMVLMREPRNGRFLVMEVEEVKRDVILNLQFALTEHGDYRLYAVTPRKNSPLFQSIEVPNDFVVGCRVHENNIAEMASKVNEAIANDDKKFQDVIRNQIMTPECGKPPFANKTDAMVAGISDVFKSDKAWDVATEKKMTTAVAKDGTERSVATHGLYLQCLRYYELDTHASRIAAAPTHYLTDPTQAFSWHITCETGGGGGGSDAKGKTISHRPVSGEFEILEDHSQMVTFFDDPTSKKPRTIADYAQTFFHEMLHFSFIPDENVTRNIEQCCSQTDPGTQSCKDLEHRLAIQKIAQSAENQVILALKDRYGDYRNLLREAYGDSGDAVMKRFYQQIGEAYQKLKDGNKCTFEVDAKHPSDLQRCQNLLNTQLRGLVSRYFGDSSSSECHRYTASTMSEGNSQSFCKDLAGYTDVLFGLDPKGLGKQFCPVKNVASIWRTLELFVNSVHADEPVDDPSVELCNLSKATHTVADSDHLLDDSYQPQPVDISLRQDTITLPEKTDTSQTAENGTTVAPNPASTSKQTSYRGGPDTQGPRRPDYSGTPTARAWRIESDFSHRDDGFNRQLGSLTDTLARTAVQPASAATEISAADAARAKTGSQAPAWQLNVPNLSISDPMSGRLLNEQALNLSDPSRRPAANQNPASAASASTATGQQTSVVPGSGLTGSVSSTGLNGSFPGRGFAQMASVDGEPQGPDKTKVPKDSPADERAEEALLVYLQRPFSVVKPELARPSVINSLQRHKIQVIDDEGQFFGSGYPRKTLEYNAEKRRLVLRTAKPE